MAVVGMMLRFHFFFPFPCRLVFVSFRFVLFYDVRDSGVVALGGCGIEKIVLAKKGWAMVNNNNNDDELVVY